MGEMTPCLLGRNCKHLQGGKECWPLHVETTLAQPWNKNILEQNEKTPYLNYEGLDTYYL